MKASFLEFGMLGAYDDFLNRQNHRLLYYSLPYKNLLQDFLHCDSLYTVATQGDQIFGILPLMKRAGKYGDVLNSLPFYGSHGGVIAENMEAKMCLYEFYNQITQEFASATYITHPFDDDHEGIVYDVSDDRIGQWTPLCEADTLLKSFEGSTRRNILKAKKAGIVIHNTADIDFLYQTHFDNISQIGGIPKERRFFELIDSHLLRGREYEIHTAYYQDECIAALLLFYYGDVVEYYTPATLQTYRTLQALPLIVYTAMCDAYDKGYSWWNWGGSWKSQEGVYRFKRKFGAINKPYQYLTKINHNLIYRASKEELLKEYPYFYVIPFDQLQGE